MALTTNIIYKIGIHATAGTTKPSAATLGNHPTLTGFVELGSKDRGDDGNLDEDSITMPFARSFSMIKGPLDLAAKDHVLNSAGATDFTFVAYDVTEDVLELDSNMSVTSHVGTLAHSTTKRTVYIEINGLAGIYFPQCVVTIPEITGAVAGDKGATRAMFEIKPEGTAALPAGFSIDWFQAA